VDGLREEADRIHAELAAAEQEWQERGIARRRVDTVLAPDADSTPARRSTRMPRGAAKVKSQVPVWREGLVWLALSVDYQRILHALTDRVRLHQGPLNCQEMAAGFGMDVVPARVEALRSKAKRLVARGWLTEPAPGRFTLSQGVAARDSGS
jgi:hypothetical protein